MATCTAAARDLAALRTDDTGAQALAETAHLSAAHAASLQALLLHGSLLCNGLFSLARRVATCTLVAQEAAAKARAVRPSALLPRSVLRASQCMRECRCLRPAARHTHIFLTFAGRAWEGAERSSRADARRGVAGVGGDSGEVPAVAAGGRGAGRAAVGTVAAGKER